MDRSKIRDPNVILRSLSLFVRLKYFEYTITLSFRISFENFL